MEKLLVACSLVSRCRNLEEQSADRNADNGAPVGDIPEGNKVASPGNIYMWKH